MRIKHVLAFILALIVVAGWPLGALGSDIEASEPYLESSVTCIVLSEYDFSAPEDAIIAYPQTSVVLGEFVVGDLLLKSNETLFISLSLGQMSDDNGEVLIYNVISNVPGKIDSSQSGLAYNIALKMNSDQFEGASAGTYSAPLLFQVTSSITGGVVWEKIVYVRAIKNDNGGEQIPPSSASNSNMQVDSGNIDETDSENEANINQESEMEIDEPVPAAIDNENDKTSEGMVADNAVWEKLNHIDDRMVLLLIICGGSLLLIIIFIVAFRLKKCKNSK